MPEEEAKELDDYAASLELNRPAVCVLLVHRELRRRRLKQLRRTVPPYSGVKEGVRVTARIADRNMKDEFAKHLKDVGVGSDEAASILFRAELKDKQGRAELAWDGNRG